jgi:hypothetical protein
VLEDDFAPDALAVDIGPVETPQVAQNEMASVALLDDAMLLGNDLVEQLNRVVRVPTEAVGRPQVDRLLSFGGCKDQLRHGKSLILARFDAGG